MPAAFLSTTFSQEFPESRWKIPVIIGSFTLSSFVGVTRILSGDHFLTDVLAGAAIGSLYGWLIPTLHKRNSGSPRREASVMTTISYRKIIRFIKIQIWSISINKSSY